MKVILLMWVVLAGNMVPSSLFWNSSDALNAVSLNVMVSYLLHQLLSLSLSWSIFLMLLQFSLQFTLFIQRSMQPYHSLSL